MLTCWTDDKQVHSLWTYLHIFFNFLSLGLREFYSKGIVIKHQIRLGGTFGHSFNFRLETNGLKNPPGLSGSLMQEEIKVKEFLKCRKNKILSFILNFKCCMWLLYRLHKKHVQVQKCLKPHVCWTLLHEHQRPQHLHLQGWKHPTNSTKFSVWHKMHHDICTIFT